MTRDNGSCTLHPTSLEVALKDKTTTRPSHLSFIYLLYEFGPTSPLYGKDVKGLFSFAGFPFF